MEIFLDDFVDYELKMLNFCDIKGILPVRSIKEDEGVRLCFDKTYYPIFFKDDKITYTRCKQIFRTLKTLYYTMSDYLLNYDKLDLEIDNLMINDKDEVAFIYVPKDEKKEDFFERMEKFIVQVIGNMDDDEKILNAMHKMGVKDKINESNIDYFFEMF